MERACLTQRDGTACPPASSFTHSLHGDPKIVDERLLHSLTRFGVGSPQHSGRMIGGHYLAKWCVDDFAPALCHTERASQQSLRGGRAQADNDSRMQQLELGVQPGATGRDLARTGLGVQSALPAWLPL